MQRIAERLEFMNTMAVKVCTITEIGRATSAKIHVFVQLFKKSLPEKKMLDSLCRFLVELLRLTGEDYV